MPFGPLAGGLLGGPVPTAARRRRRARASRRGRGRTSTCSATRRSPALERFAAAADGARRRRPSTLAIAWLLAQPAVTCGHRRRRARSEHLELALRGARRRSSRAHEADAIARAVLGRRAARAASRRRRGGSAGGRAGGSSRCCQNSYVSGRSAVAAPVLRPRYVASAILALELGDRLVELARGPRARGPAVTPRPPAARRAGASRSTRPTPSALTRSTGALDAHLPPERIPVEEQRRARVRLELAALAASVAGEEDEAVLVGALQEHHADGRRAVRGGRGRQAPSRAARDPGRLSLARTSGGTARAGRVHVRLRGGRPSLGHAPEPTCDLGH